MRAGDAARPPSRSVLIRLLIVTALIAASGCSAYGAPSASDAEAGLPSADEAADRYRSLDTVSATVTTVQERNDDGTVTTVTRKRKRIEPWAYHERVLAVNRTDGARGPLVAEGGFVIANGSTLTFYDPASDRLNRISVRGGNGSAESPYPRLVGAARSGRSVTHPTLTPGVSPLPAVPVEGDSERNGSTPYREGNVTVTYAGTETIDGRQTYRLELTPVSPEMSLRSQTLWLDTQYLYPLKRHTKFDAHGDSYEYTITHRDVVFNPTFDAGTFRLDPDEVPNGTDRARFSNYDSRAAMAAAVELPVPALSASTEFEFDSASYRSTDPEFATIRYERPGSDGELRLFVFGTTRESTAGTPVQIGEYEARRTRTNGTTAITWTTDEHTFRVSGHVDNATLSRVARSVVETL
ncbi:LolA family protein [Halobellus litoreus]|uniref:Outer membrane lipoprotein carrier protein LolA n=1 Tax=Halobellus litoreus TaxID=755310 RepID=A0ABD6DSC2_9EURY|nr:hypothetical protein [Halobellus litoreus]